MRSRTGPDHMCRRFVCSALLALGCGTSTAGVYEYECLTTDYLEVGASGKLEQPPYSPQSLAVLKALSGKPFHVDRKSGTVLGSYPFWLPPQPDIHVLSRGSHSQSFTALYVGIEHEGGRRVIVLGVRESDRTDTKPFVATDSSGSVYSGMCN